MGCVPSAMCSMSCGSRLFRRRPCVGRVACRWRIASTACRSAGGYQSRFARCWGLNFRQLRWAPRDKASSVGPNHGAVVTLLVTPSSLLQRAPTPVLFGHNKPKRRQGPGHVREILTTKIRLGALEDLPRHRLKRRGGPSRWATANAYKVLEQFWALNCDMRLVAASASKAHKPSEPWPAFARPRPCY